MDALYEKLLALCARYYPNESDPLAVFMQTLRGRERQAMQKIAAGEKVENGREVLLHCILVLQQRLSHPDSPNGDYDK